MSVLVKHYVPGAIKEEFGKKLPGNKSGVTFAGEYSPENAQLNIVFARARCSKDNKDVFSKKEGYRIATDRLTKLDRQNMNVFKFDIAPEQNIHTTFHHAVRQLIIDRKISKNDSNTTN